MQAKIGILNATDIKYDDAIYTTVDSALDYIIGGAYVKVIGDTMTGPLVITPTSGTTALIANKAIILKAGQKLIFDGG